MAALAVQLRVLILLPPKSLNDDNISCSVVFSGVLNYWICLQLSTSLSTAETLASTVADSMNHDNVSVYEPHS